MSKGRTKRPTGVVLPAIFPPRVQTSINRAKRGVLELTRLRGHLTVVAGGVHDGRQDGPVYAGVQAADGGVSPVRADRGIAVEGVRSLRDDDRDVDQAAARDAGKGDGGLSSAEREELTRLRRENRRLKEEREILSKAAAWFATESGPSKRSSGS